MAITDGWRQRRTRRYLLHALEIVERRALFSDTVDWPTVRAEAVAACAGAVSYTGIHDTVWTVVKQAGGAHSGLRRPGPASAWGTGTLPSGKSSTVSPGSVCPPAANAVADTATPATS
ncbi:hypothetical protein [Dactylosporangium cerinum]